MGVWTSVGVFADGETSFSYTYDSSGVSQAVPEPYKAYAPISGKKSFGGVQLNEDVYKRQVTFSSDNMEKTYDIFGEKYIFCLLYTSIRSFLNAVITGGEAPVPTSQIIYNQAILDGIQRSSDCGHEVEDVYKRQV